MNRFNPERIDHWLLLSIIPLSLISAAILYGFSRQVLMPLGLFRYEFFVILALFCMVVLGVIQKRRWDNQLKKSKQSENAITLDETPKKPASITDSTPQLQTPQDDSRSEIPPPPHKRTQKEIKDKIEQLDIRDYTNSEIADYLVENGYLETCTEKTVRNYRTKRL
jgi:hypothetical protein